MVLAGTNLGIEIVKLGIAIRMRRTFAGFPIRLQRIVLGGQQLRHHLMADTVTQRLQLDGQLTHAQGRPPQGRVGIAGRRRFYQRLQIRSQAGILHHFALASPTRVADSSRTHRIARFQFLNSTGNGGAG